MTERVARMREYSISTHPHISSERARIVTRVYKEQLGRVPAPILRALCFYTYCCERELYLGPDELIVGEKTEKPLGAPTFPELCCHTGEDFRVIRAREKIAFDAPDGLIDEYERDIRPFWHGRSMREKLLSAMTEEWKAAYGAGIFTEFMEQRSPGHTVADGKIYKKGFADFLQDIEAARASLDFLTDPLALRKDDELRAMAICCKAMIRLGERYSELALSKAQDEIDPKRRAEYIEIAETCRRVPRHAPRTFREALQMYWFCHIGVTTEMNTWDSYSPGRLDQHLLPFYREGLRDGSLTEEQARELLGMFWVKFNNQPAPPKVGVTLLESGTYTDFANINLGGLTPEGADGVNEVTYLLLDTIEEMRILQPSSNLQLSRKNPDAFLKRALRIIKTGFGQPSIFNADAVIEEMLRCGKDIVDARQGGTSGCVETGCFGKEAYILTGYFNLPKILELALNDGLDPRTGERLGPHTGSADALSDESALLNAFNAQLRYFVDIKIRGNQVIERLYGEEMPAPLLSVLTDDCVSRGADYHAGGARYNTRYIQGVGIGTITDSLSAIAERVYEKKELTLPALVSALNANFEGEQALREKLYSETPRYGNDDERADKRMRRVFEMYRAAIDARPTAYGGEYHIDMLPTTCHVYFGQVLGATPDGRLAGEPVSEGISPVQGTDKNGPTAVVRSAAKMDHLRTGGTLLNMKFTPGLLRGDEGISAVAALVRTYFRMDGHHIQFNVVDRATLLDAQAHPERHKNLIVRVAGYSDYFANLAPALQNEIIARTEQDI